MSTISPLESIVIHPSRDTLASSASDISTPTLTSVVITPATDAVDIYPSLNILPNELLLKIFDTAIQQGIDIPFTVCKRFNYLLNDIRIKKSKFEFLKRYFPYRYSKLSDNLDVEITNIFNRLFTITKNYNSGKKHLKNVKRRHLASPLSGYLEVSQWLLEREIEETEIGKDFLEQLPPDLNRLNKISILKRYKADYNLILLYKALYLPLPIELDDLNALNIHEKSQDIRIWFENAPPDLISRERLYLERCGLTEIPIEIKRFTQLKEFSLSKNRISYICSDIFTGSSLVNLEELNLESNLLISLPEGLPSLNSLKILNVKDNKIKTLPSELFQLTQLTSLLFQHNMITAIPRELGSLTSLEGFSLSDNPIKRVPRELLEHPNPAIRNNLLSIKKNIRSKQKTKIFFATLAMLYFGQIIINVIIIPNIKKNQNDN